MRKLRVDWLLTIGMLLWVGIACNQPATHTEASTIPNLPTLPDSLEITLPYDLYGADGISFILPPVLNEASGLDVLPNGQLVMVQDEQGAFFIFDPSLDSVVRKETFSLPGDFEGVEWLPDSNWMVALRSDGTLFRIADWDTDEPKMKMWRTALSEEDDTEGLGYDPQTGQLLILCKEPARHKNWNDRWRAAYVYDWKTEEIDIEASLTIDLAEIKAVMTRDATTPKEQARAAEFDIMKEKYFKPAGIAVHPITGNYYVIASAGQRLIVCNREGHVLTTTHLKRKRFHQPEGIAFAPNGDLYILNEAREDEPMLLRFTYRP